MLTQLHNCASYSKYAVVAAVFKICCCRKFIAVQVIQNMLLSLLLLPEMSI